MCVSFLPTYLGDKYWVFKEVTAEPGYPHSLVELGISLPREGIDTALRWEPVGKTYFFKGDRYWRYNEDKRATDPGYPKPITVWRGIPQAPQGAFVSKEGCTYPHFVISGCQTSYREASWELVYIFLLRRDLGLTFHRIALILQAREHSH